MLAEVVVCLLCGGLLLSESLTGLSPPCPSQRPATPVRAFSAPAATPANKPSEVPSLSTPQPLKQSKPSGLSRILGFFAASSKQPSSHSDS